MGKLNGARIISATLVETIVALVILLSLTAIAVIVFVQVTVSANPGRMQGPEGLIDSYIAEICKGGPYHEREIEDSDFIIRSEIIQSPPAAKTVWIKIMVFDRNKSLIKSQNMILPAP